MSAERAGQAGQAGQYKGVAHPVSGGTSPGTGASSGIAGGVQAGINGMASHASITGTSGVAGVTVPDYPAIEARAREFDHLVNEMHNEAMRTSPAEMASHLQEILSTKLVAYMTNQSDRTVLRWARGEVQEIRQESKRRLITCYEITLLISKVFSPDVAKTWFIGHEPQLDFVMPAKAISQGDLEDALAAARSFVAGA